LQIGMFAIFPQHVPGPDPRLQRLSFPEGRATDLELQCLSGLSFPVPLSEPRRRAGFREPSAGRPSSGWNAARSRRANSTLIGASLTAADNSLDDGQADPSPLNS
jgi:hypothetical protein